MPAMWDISCCCPAGMSIFFSWLSCADTRGADRSRPKAAHAHEFLRNSFIKSLRDSAATERRAGARPQDQTRRITERRGIGSGGGEALSGGTPTLIDSGKALIHTMLSRAGAMTGTTGAALCGSATSRSGAWHGADCGAAGVCRWQGGSLAGFCGWQGNPAQRAKHCACEHSRATIRARAPSTACHFAARHMNTVYRSDALCTGMSLKTSVGGSASVPPTAVPATPGVWSAATVPTASSDSDHGPPLSRQSCGTSSAHAPGA